MDLRTLETFLHVIRSGAVGKTALRLNVTQSAISRRLHGLEKELGVKLFTPEGRGIRPTNAATSLIPEIEAAIKTLEAIKFKDPNVSSEATVLRVAAIGLHKVTRGQVYLTSDCNIRCHHHPHPPS
ncbi:LysR family transcriptional regulator [Sulfitobacter sp.]|uniref:LysR family transcriptional regulator n=1 Tax=Sulfitobacter sp. TaxID=1903071 RepID=UPI00300240B6